MDQSPKPGIQPLPLGQPLEAASAQQPSASAAAAPSLDQQVDKWLDAHPDDKKFTESPDIVKATGTTEPPAQVPPGGESAPGSTETPPAEPAKPVEAPPTTEPAVAAPQAQAPPVEKPAPAVAEPIKFSLDAKYSFVEGSQPWTGQQVVDALRERSALIPKAQEADVFREVFEMPAAQAKELWAPNISWLRQHPQQVDMIGSIIADPTKADYLLQCSQYWDSPEGQHLRAQSAPQTTAAPAMSPDVQKRFEALETQNRQLQAAETERRKYAATQRITRELNVAFERYPYLRDNPAMVQALLARAYWLNGGDDNENSKGVLDALEMERDLYDSKLAALNQATEIARESAAPLPPAPPLVGSAGASPQATPTRAAGNKKFGSLDDAVDDWFNNPPAQFR